MPASDALRVVVCGACGSHAGVVLEWPLQQLLARAGGLPVDSGEGGTAANSDGAAFRLATVADVVEAIRAAWPKALADAPMDDRRLQLLYQGRLLADDAIFAAVLPGLVDAAVDKQRIDSGDLVLDEEAEAAAKAAGGGRVLAPLLHLVFRRHDACAKRGDDGGAAEKDRPRRTEARESACCVVS
jgi:hypothetical protein